MQSGIGYEQQPQAGWAVSGPVTNEMTQHELVEGNTCDATMGVLPQIVLTEASYMYTGRKRWVSSLDVEIYGYTGQALYKARQHNFPRIVKVGSCISESEMLTVLMSCCSYRLQVNAVSTSNYWTWQKDVPGSKVRSRHDKNPFLLQSLSYWCIVWDRKSSFVVFWLILASPCLYIGVHHCIPAHFLISPKYLALAGANHRSSLMCVCSLGLKAMFLWATLTEYWSACTSVMGLLSGSD
jgi:hypothetical protein